MGAVGASLTTDLVDLISARVWLCVAQVQRALVQALAARPATTTGCSGGVVVLLLELRGAGTLLHGTRCVLGVRPRLLSDL